MTLMNISTWSGLTSPPKTTKITSAVNLRMSLVCIEGRIDRTERTGENRSQVVSNASAASTRERLPQTRHSRFHGFKLVAGRSGIFAHRAPHTRDLRSRAAPLEAGERPPVKGTGLVTLPRRCNLPLIQSPLRNSAVRETSSAPPTGVMPSRPPACRTRTLRLLRIPFRPLNCRSPGRSVGDIGGIRQPGIKPAVRQQGDDAAGGSLTAFHLARERHLVKPRRTPVLPLGSRKDWRGARWACP